MAAKKKIVKTTEVEQNVQASTTLKLATTPVNKFQQPGKTKNLTGSILNPEIGGLRLVLSLNNMSGDPKGNPLLPTFDKKWPKVREESRGWYANKNGATYKFGALKDIAVQSDVWVVGMLCQEEDLSVNPEGLLLCLKNVRKMAKEEHATVHVSSLLVDEAPLMKELLQTELVNQGVSVYFYSGN